jgi:hypothetical protein
MRCMMKVEFPVDTANNAMCDGSFSKTMQSILDDMKPEAVYFIAENGDRTALIFFDMQDSSQMPAVAEPLFLAFGCGVTIVPAMTLEDLGKAGPGIEAAVKKYGG